VMQMPTLTKRQGANQSLETRNAIEAETRRIVAKKHQRQTNSRRCSRITLTVQPPFILLRLHLVAAIAFEEFRMFEAIVALLTVLSVGIFAAHAVDAVRS
jgi:hypothetical protein